MDSIPYSEVRAQLAETLKRLALRDEAIYISRRGQPAGVLMSVAQYERLQGGIGDFGNALLAWRQRYESELAAASNEEWQDPFADVRDRSPDGGRPPFAWPDIDLAGLELQPPTAAPESEATIGAPAAERERTQRSKAA
jgi:prevent-host-death family protein